MVETNKELESDQKSIEEKNISTNVFEPSAVLIGLSKKNHQMEKFIYKINESGLNIFDAEQLKERIKIVSKFISTHLPKKVCIIPPSNYNTNDLKKYSDIMGTSILKNKFVPGTLTNPSLKYFIEPEVIFLIDPSSSKQIFLEAKTTGAFIISLCNTDNSIKNIDLIIPSNNKNQDSINFVFSSIIKELFLIKKNKTSL